jgi:hypothetical protein
MKKLLLFITLLNTVNLFSLDHGIITGFQVQYNIFNRLDLITDYYRYSYHNDNSISIQLKTGYRIEQFRIVGTYTNLLNVLSIDSYRPLQDDFSIDISYSITPELKISFNHTCKHPVTPQQDNRTILMDFGSRSIGISYYKEF